LALGKWLRPEDQPRELLSDHPQLVFRTDFVELVDHPDQRADMLLGPLKELLVSLGLHQTSCSTVGHNQALPAKEVDNVASGAGFPFLSRKPVPIWEQSRNSRHSWRVRSRVAHSTPAIRGLQHRQQSNHGSRTLQSGRIGLATKRWPRRRFADSSGAADGLNAAPLGTYTSEQTLLTPPPPPRGP